MSNWLKLTIGLLLAVSFVISFWAYPQLPDQIVTHWGINGKPDGYSTRLFGTFLLPAILTLLAFVFAYLPQIDPLKKNWETFRGSYYLFIAILFAFMTYVHGLFIYANLYDSQLNIGQFMMPAMGAFMLVLGYIMPSLKRNWFIGIRTPWTISSDEVWRKTHLLGSKLFMLSGIATISVVIAPEIGFWVFMGTIMGSVLILLAYSYMAYQSEMKKGKL